MKHIAATLTLQLQKFEDETLENNEKEGNSSAPGYTIHHHKAAEVQAAEAVHRRGSHRAKQQSLTVCQGPFQEWSQAESELC